MLDVVHAPVQNDGSFAFSNLNSGTYNVEIGNRQRGMVTIEDKDIEGIDFVIPVIRQVRGRVVVEGTGPGPRFDVEFSKVPEEPEYGVSSVPGTFQALLPEGDVWMKFYGFPDPYQIRSITFGDVDLLKEPLRVSGTHLPDIVVTLGLPGPTTRVKGQILNASGQPLMVSTRLVVALFTKWERISMRAAAGPDGSFEFFGVPPGIYTVDAPGSIPILITVEGQDIDVSLNPR